jgi:hypothetical protein
MTPDSPDGWRPIESAPKDGSWIIATSTWNQYYRVALQWSGDGWLDVNEAEDELGSATHWMPFPEPPK